MMKKWNLRNIIYSAVTSSAIFPDRTHKMEEEKKDLKKEKKERKKKKKSKKKKIEKKKNKRKRKG